MPRILEPTTRVRSIGLALLACALSCHRTTTAQTNTHTETSTVTDTKTSESGATTTTTTTTEAPGETTTTTEEFSDDPDPADNESAPTGQPDGGVSTAPPRPPARVLVRRTVTVTKHGPVTTESHQQATTQAQGASETKAATKADVQTQAETDSKPAVSCALTGLLWWGVIVVAVFGLALLALKRRGIV